MQILFSNEEDAAIKRYAIQKDISFQQAIKRITDAMTEGLMKLIAKDERELRLKDELTERKKVTTKIETLDINTPDSDNS